MFSSRHLLLDSGVRLQSCDIVPCARSNYNRTRELLGDLHHGSSKHQKHLGSVNSFSGLSHDVAGDNGVEQARRRTVCPDPIRPCCGNNAEASYISLVFLRPESSSRAGCLQAAMVCKREHSYACVHMPCLTFNEATSSLIKMPRVWARLSNEKKFCPVDA
jgi:hypothetical protein